MHGIKIKFDENKNRKKTHTFTYEHLHYICIKDAKQRHQTNKQ